jgi:hypothetical protein
VGMSGSIRATLSPSLTPSSSSPPAALSMSSSSSEYVMVLPKYVRAGACGCLLADSLTKSWRYMSGTSTVGGTCLS